MSRLFPSHIFGRFLKDNIVKKCNRGMSSIDLVVIVGMLVVAAAGFTWYAYKYGFSKTVMGYTLFFILTFLILLPLWLYNDWKGKLHLKELFEKDMIDKDYYRQLVGEKFYQKNHGDDPG